MELTSEELQHALSKAGMCEYPSLSAEDSSNELAFPLSCYPIHADIAISQPKLDTMISSMDKSGSGKVTFEEWRDFLLLLPRPASMGNVWKYWTSHTSPRLATSIANQDLDVILAEKPAPPASSSSFSASTASAHTHSNTKHELSVEAAEEEEDDEDSSPIFAGSGAYLLAGGLAGAGN